MIIKDQVSVQVWDQVSSQVYDRKKEDLDVD